MGAFVCLDIYECLYVYKHTEFVGPYMYMSGRFGRGHGVCVVMFMPG